MRKIPMTNDHRPTFLASDLEGVLIPEIWVAVGEKTGIKELSLTTREVADYDELMRMRLKVLAEHNLTIADVQAVIASMEPLPGAIETINWIRERTRFVIITDSFYEFLTPFNTKLGYPMIFAHSLKIDRHGAVVGYQLRLEHGKRKAVRAIKELGFRVMAFGDSYNDTAMLDEADFGVLYKPPGNVVADFPQFPVANDYTGLKALANEFLRPPVIM
jgi:phosphoserine / homoserine phosphotransferase